MTARAEATWQVSVGSDSTTVMPTFAMTVVHSLPTPEDMQGVEGAERGGFRFEITKEQWKRRRAASGAR